MEHPTNDQKQRKFFRRQTSGTPSEALLLVEIALTRTGAIFFMFAALFRSTQMVLSSSGAVLQVVMVLGSLLTLCVMVAGSVSVIG